MIERWRPKLDLFAGSKTNQMTQLVRVKYPQPFSALVLQPYVALVF
jgi:hypothetical protein